jgi:ribonuclease III
MSSEQESPDTCLGHRFHDPALLHRALTHPSWGLEHSEADNERLEFLGDAVITFIVADYLFETFPDAAEGELTKMKNSLISGQTLARVARECDLPGMLRLGRGARREKLRDSILENAFEAVVGAVYLDAGIERAAAVVLEAMGERLDEAALRVTRDDPKSRLQQETQRRGLGLPVYRVTHRIGPAHAPSFTVVVSLDGEPSGTGSGTSKQAAERDAAADALRGLR